MPIKYTVYKCSVCGKAFDSYEQANSHEYTCDKCNSCEHGYYVYGCGEFACRYYDRGECGAKNGFMRYEKKQ